MILHTAQLTLAAISSLLLIWVLWVLYKVRDDQIVIRAWIGHELRRRKVSPSAPSLAEWLEAHPDRPHKYDPPLNPEPR